MTVASLPIPTSAGDERFAWEQSPPVWTTNGSDVVLRAEIPVSAEQPAGGLRLVCRASFSYLRSVWTEDLPLPADGLVVAQIVPPPSAWLHELASDYLTDLAVRIEVLDASGQVSFELVAPPAFVAWPTGPAAPPVVWDAATAAALAPRGIVSERVRSAMGDDGDTGRVLPPVSRPGPPLGDETELDPDRATLGLPAIEEDGT